MDALILTPWAQEYMEVRLVAEKYVFLAIQRGIRPMIRLTDPALAGVMTNHPILV